MPKRIIAALAALTLLAACVQQPVIQFFTASDTTVTAGSSVTLTWAASSYDSLTLTPAVGDVTGLFSYTVFPTETTIYTLSARQGGATQSQSVEVRVGEAPVIISFTASPNPASPGQPATLAWVVEGATSLAVDNGVGDVTGQTSAVVTVSQDTSYALTASNDFGSVSETLQLRVGQGPTIGSFSASPENLSEPGGPVTLSWNVSGEGDVRVSIDQGVGAVSPVGSKANVQVGQTTTFTLTASDDRGTRTATTTVRVGRAPTIGSFTASVSIIPTGESVQLNWNVSGDNDTSVRLEPGVGPVPETGSRTATPSSTTTYTLTAESSLGSDSRSVTVTVVPRVQQNITFLIAGQSNASGRGELTNVEPSSPNVRMLGNDYVWKTATEPIDSNQGQLDSVSRDADAGHSFGVTLGKALAFFQATGRSVYLIPSALGGSCLTSSCSNSDWRPGDPTNRNTLFGSAVYRARVSAGLVSNPPAPPEGGPVNALIWYQGESDNNTPELRRDFIANTATVMNAFRANNALGDVPILYAQIGLRRQDATRNLEYQDARERQRRMETGYGDSSQLTRFYMVVTHDLPMVDQNHLNTEGQKELGRRLALAYQEHILGFPVDGTGPRLVSLEMDPDIPNAIKVKTTRTINETSNKYDAYFTVYANRVAISAGDVAVERHPEDDTAILLRLPSGTTGNLSVTYSPPTNRALGVWATGAVKDPATGLPLPAFGDGRLDSNDNLLGLPVPYSAGTP